MIRNPPANAGGEGNGNPLPYSCLENPMDGPFEGTFNMLIDKEDMNKLDVIKSSSGYLIKGFSNEGRSFGNVIAYKAKIRNIDCAVVVPERSHYKEIIEIICQYHLRRTLSLNEGDDIDLKVEI